MPATRMGSPQSPEQETGRDGKTGTTPFDPLAESRRLASEFERAMQRHTQADHFAGLADFEPLAQALLAHVGREGFVHGVREVRTKGGEYFYDVLCALIPSAKDRLRFYKRNLAKLQQQSTAAGTGSVRTNGNGVPHNSVHTEHQKIPVTERELFVRRCQRLDRMLRFVPTQIAKRVLIRFSPRGKAERKIEKNGHLLRPNFDFNSIRPDQFDEPGLSEELRQSDDDLSQFRDVEKARFTSELERLSVDAEDVVRRIHEEITRVREQVYAKFSSQYAKLSHDLPILAAPLFPSEQQPRSVLESTVGKAGQKMNIAALERAKKTLDHAMEQEIARQTETLQKILAIIPQVLRPPSSKKDPSRMEPTQVHGNGKRHSGSHRNTSVPVPVTGAAK